MKIALVVNPTAGSGRGAKVGKEFSQELYRREIDFQLIQGASLQASLELLEGAIAAGQIDTLISVGGDGQAHALFQIAIKYDFPILIVPGGTGNDFARSVGTYKKSAQELIEYIFKTEPVYVDMGLVRHAGGERYFGEVLSAGFDSQVNRRANGYRKLKGKNRYVAAIFQELTKFIPTNYRLTIDGKAETESAILIAIANGATYGGGMKIAPAAKLNDSALDMVLIKPISLLLFLTLFPKVFWGGHIGHPKVRVERFREIFLEGDIWIYADGEEICQAPAQIQVAPAKLATWIYS